MSSIANPNDRAQRSPTANLDLRVSTYDRVASLLIALLILVGFFVLLMFVIWLTSNVLTSTRAVPVTLIEDAGGGGGAQGDITELEEPLEQEVVELTEIDPIETLKEIQDISAQVAALELVQGDPNSSGDGPGTGDGRGVGPGGDGENVIPRHERWVIRYQGTSVAGYAEQLDSFGIELGLVHLDSPRIDYARNLSSARPDVRQGARDQEKRLYFRPQESVIANWTNQLLAKAGIDMSNGRAHQFFSPKVENDLALLEQQAAGNRDQREYKTTVFGVRPAGARYEFYVISQQFRAIPR